MHAYVSYVLAKRKNTLTYYFFFLLTACEIDQTKRNLIKTQLLQKLRVILRSRVLRVVVVYTLVKDTGR